MEIVDVPLGPQPESFRHPQGRLDPAAQACGSRSIKAAPQCLPVGRKTASPFEQRQDRRETVNGPTPERDVMLADYKVQIVNRLKGIGSRVCRAIR
ncbi:MAG: hypothetical protein R3E58_00775 [Phycisphaerae bacterium]